MLFAMEERKKSHPFTVKRRLCIKNTLKLKLEGMKLENRH